MQAFELAKKCANCKTRFSTKVSRQRKRTLIGQPAVLLAINNERRNANKQTLDYNSIICHGCHRKFEYSGDMESSSTAESIGDADELGMNISESSCEGEYSQPEIEHPVASSSSMGAQVRYNKSKCCHCFRRFDKHPQMRVRRLPEGNPVLLFINGILKGECKEELPPGSYVCNKCYLKFFKARCKSIARTLVCSPPTSQIETPRCADGGDEDMEDSLASSLSSSSLSSSSSTSSSSPEPQSSLHVSESLPPCYTSSSSSSSSSDVEALASPERKRLATLPGEIQLPIKTIAHSTRGCFICKLASSRSRIKIQARMQIWIEHSIFIGKECRICKNHIDPTSRLFNDEAVSVITTLPFESLTRMNAKQLVDFIKDISSCADTNCRRGRLSFSGKDNYAEKDYKEFFGLEKKHFEELHNLCSSHLRNTRARCTKDALALCLMKMRVNPSQRFLGSAFNISQSSVSKAINAVRNILKQTFVPRHIGYNHITRDDYINNYTTGTSKLLTEATETQAIVVVDGTYLYIQKSKNYKTQRLTYSPHKYRNLLKAMMLVSTTGYILHVDGPYIANGSNNDANIMKKITTDMNGFRNFFIPGDYVIEDRGFRDCNTLLSSLGYSIKMPHFLGGKRNQHTTLEANESRLVTKIRWIVESVNGRIKNVFRFFRDVIPNTYVKDNAIWDFFEIACALLNAYHPPIKVDTAEDLLFASYMLERVDMDNLLQLRLEEANLIRKTVQWRPVDAETLADFPRLSLSDLRRLTLGVYQINQAPSYMADQDDGDYDIFWHAELGTSAIRFRIQSRFRNSKTHSLWVGYNPDLEGYKSVTGWYCLCENGARIVGCCAHIAAIVWYFGYARYLPTIQIPNILKQTRDASTFQYDGEAVDIDDDLNIFSEED